ncbi:MAG: aminotransferase class III-fold pyridoxal phosphate-dependent enzyme, partial [Anaerolineales bacterium]|nr:aminotransferase class III-fold pyridoxal phosphate-dependent enzyme [Anaerolineales bacterium]
VTDNPSIISPFNASNKVEFVTLDDLKTTKSILLKGDVAAVIIEGIQGVGGIHVPDNAFLTGLREVCTQTGTLLILDEIQSGYGRSGKFFAHQFAGIRPDLITVAKGMGNGFPVAGVLISPAIEASPGLLGTTFGGNHLACAAAQSVLDVFENEQLIKNAATTGAYLKHRAREIKGVKSIRGLGLMIGLEFEPEIADIRRKLLFDHHIFTGYSGKNTLRLLPPLCITIAEIDHLIDSLKIITENLN